MQQNISIGPKVDINDLGNGFYSQLAQPSKYDDDYKNKLKWLAQECTKLPSDIRLIAQSQAGDITEGQDAVPALPTVIAFGTGAEEYRLDASLLDIFPHVSRIELINRYGGGDPYRFVMYEPPKPNTPDGRPSPVGGRWPDKGPNAYRPSDDNPRAEGYVEGQIYEDASGAKYKLTFQTVWVVRFPVWIKVA